MSPVSLERLALQYVRDRVALGELDPRTARNDRRALLLFTDHVGPIPVGELVSAHVEGYMMSLTVGRSTARAKFSKIRTFCRWLVRHGHLATDPTMDLKAPKQPRSVPRAFRAEIVERLLEVAPDPRARLVCLLEVQEGLRACEVSRLEMGDVDFGEQTVLIRGKGASERLLPISGQTWSALSDYLIERGMKSGPLVLSYTEPWKGISPEHVAHLVQQWLVLAGASGGGHGLRHTMATTLLREGGADIRDVQMALGHASLTSTQIYLPFSDARRLRKVMDGRWYGSTTRAS